MIGFNTLLLDEGISPAVVRLVRHQDTRSKSGRTPYQLWQSARNDFELYQKIQHRLVFGNGEMLASFVNTPLDETLFVGMYEVVGVGKAVQGLLEPITEVDVSDHHFYDLVPSHKLEQYSERLVINWGPGYRAWVQLAENQNKTITEIRRDPKVRPFPGFLDFRETLSSLANVPPLWREMLSQVKGVYLLTDPVNGKLYVGSAQGEGGIWGRWEQYVASGHGGNRRMQDVPAADYQLSVLEIASSSTLEDELLRMESRWKLKLLSREFGLNAN